MDPRKLILRNAQCPGDIVMLSAAVRDLHRAHPGKFATDVRTSCPAIWDHNPNIAGLPDDGPDVELIDCVYPLIHESNTGPWHFLHGFHAFLSGRLGIYVKPTAFRGDIHISDQEKSWMSQVQEITKESTPFWIVAAGGKYDFTAKWWAHERYQTVVDSFRNRILFVQVGENGHHHPALRGVLDLRGKTNLRQLIRLVYHAQGVLCPVTLSMHLAAAVPTKPGTPKNRPCVVVAGGREPSQWEAYPHHQYIHTNGALTCCDNGGCWRSRVIPLGDGDQKDRNLCLDVVELTSGRRQSGQAWANEGATVSRMPHGNTVDGANEIINHVEETRWLPRCLDMITADEVIRRIEMYFSGGVVKYLTGCQAAIARKEIPALGWEAGVAMGYQSQVAIAA